MPPLGKSLLSTHVSCYLFPMTVLFIHFQSGSSKARTGAAAGAGSGSGSGSGAGTVGT